MRITVIRTGGFGGLSRRATLDTAGRPDAEELAHLADQAVREGLSEAPMGVPDGFHYEVSIESGSAGHRPGDASRPATAHFADPKLTEAQSALVRKVLKEGA
ncbi:protealysin inhibitor emfourin [Streptomyces sp. 3N207]|uniref:protealysin inhibitor emfourin n=1 Tax=Streptomyces sp. 3N207 TaxID=3457417 RepID=UPI003FD18BA5